MALSVRVSCQGPLELYAWAAHSEHQEARAGPPGPAISNALKVRSSLLPGVQDPHNQVYCIKSYQVHVRCAAGCETPSDMTHMSL
jgi:hypothetical protein